MRASFGRSRLMICAALGLALVQGLQRDELVARVGGALAAGKSHDVLDAGIGLDDIHRLLDRLLHGIKRSILRPLQPALQHAGVLLREESFRDFGDQENIQSQGAQK